MDGMLETETDDGDGFWRRIFFCLLDIKNLRKL